MKKLALDLTQIETLQQFGIECPHPTIYLNIVETVMNDNVNTQCFLSIGHVTFDEAHLSSSLCRCIPTFSFQDIWDLLPQQLNDEQYGIGTLKMQCGKLYYEFSNYEHHSTPIVVDIHEKGSLIDAAYEVLLWCLHHHYIQNQNEKE